MKELFEKQSNGTQPLTEEVLGKLKQKTYFNGEEKQIGDVVLHAMLMSEIIEKEDGCAELPLKLITLKEKHFNMFEYDERYKGNDLPTIKLKNEVVDKKYCI
jgi:hypothetical protein